VLGIGIGGEYPAGSVSCAEATGELKKGHRNRWFIFSTNFAIDAGFVVAAIVPMILVLIFTEKHLHAAWRVALGLGVIPPLSLLWLRVKLKEPEQYNRQKMNKYPVWLIIKFYWLRLIVVSLIWFIYDFSAYSFGIYSSAWLALILPKTAPLWKSFGWFVTLVYAALKPLLLCDFGLMIHASAIGTPLSTCSTSLARSLERSPATGLGQDTALRLASSSKESWGLSWLAYMLPWQLLHMLQALWWSTGMISISAICDQALTPISIFLALGEVGPGDNIGLIASKTSATCIRGQYYGIAAAVGKIGAFVGSYIFPIIQANAPNATRAGQDPFFVSSSLCIFSACLALFALPHIGQDTITEEDIKFNDYLDAHGYDRSTMGTKEYQMHRASISN
jgi:hypothetical protein